MILKNPFRPRKHTEDTGMNPHPGIPARHLAGAAGCCVKHGILSVLFRAVPWQMRFSG